MSASLRTEFLGRQYENPFMNASGVHCLTIDELEELSNSKAGAFITKSSTEVEREGNPEPRYYSTPLGSINSMGLPNRGFKYYLDYVLDYQDKHPAANTPFFSVAGMSIDENLKLLRAIQDSAFDGVTELNLSCPNVPGKPQLAYDFEVTEELLSKVFSFFKKPLGVKLPPYFDFAHFDTAASILNKFPLAYVNCINSVGNGLYVDLETESVVIKPKNGFGGIGGEYVKPTALANVRGFYTRLNSSIKIIGTGGIRTGQDAFEHLLCGATMLQVGTELYEEGVSVFERLLHELEDIMNKKGYTSIDEFRGKLSSL
ncbi:LANO_0F17656g1_1 [Lachancea nothofagi CBS 11611]|uniref:Dihydroorotate dehydrogenase (fumarate) n=1 Tax=Lachancea nothofagi CBS 11611 TaxID=1266666 RepID=A0A1G4KDA5_9SACH|nr:LANO_0F17656g1_1 [Lachancea nothofagi CBS 11611]